MISRYLRRACWGEKKPYLADPSNTQDTCHMNLASDGLLNIECGSVIEHRSAQSKVLKFHSSQELRIILGTTLVK